MRRSCDTVRRLILPATLLALALCASAPVRAQSAREQARNLFGQGNKLRKAGDHEGALIKFRAAYRLLPSFKIDLNIAFTLYDLKRNAGAAASFARFLRRGAGESPRKMVRLARLRLRQLRRKVASVRLRCTVTGAVVTVDGRRRGITPLAGELYLEPGSHRMVVSRKGYVPLALSLKMAAGEHRQRAVELQPQMRPVSLDAVEEPAQEDPILQQEDPILLQQHRRKTTVGYITLGTGLALAAAGGFMIGLGVTSGSEAHDAYTIESSKPNGNSAIIAGHREDVESARSLVLAGDVLVGVGLVALGVSIYQFVTRPRIRERGTPAMSVVPAPGGAALLVVGQF